MIRVAIHAMQCPLLACFCICLSLRSVAPASADSSCDLSDLVAVFPITGSVTSPQHLMVDSITVTNGKERHVSCLVARDGRTDQAMGYSCPELGTGHYVVK